MLGVPVWCMHCTTPLVKEEGLHGVFKQLRRNGHQLEQDAANTSDCHSTGGCTTALVPKAKGPEKNFFRDPGDTGSSTTTRLASPEQGCRLPAAQLNLSDASCRTDVSAVDSSCNNCGSRPLPLEQLHQMLTKVVQHASMIAAFFNVLQVRRPAAAIQYRDKLTCWILHLGTSQTLTSC
jgi:hypothetical protein